MLHHAPLFRPYTTVLETNTSLTCHFWFIVSLFLLLADRNTQFLSPRQMPGLTCISKWQPLWWNYIYLCFELFIFVYFCWRWQKEEWKKKLHSPLASAFFLMIWSQFSSIAINKLNWARHIKGKRNTRSVVLKHEEHKYNGFRETQPRAKFWLDSPLGFCRQDETQCFS